LEGAYQRQDVGSWGRLNWEFHRSLYLAADRVQTLSIIQSINVQTDRYIRLHLLLSHAIEEAEKEHRELLRLCTLRDADRAVPFLRDHILNTGRTLLAMLRSNRAADVA